MLFLGEGAVTYFKEDGSVDYVFNARTLGDALAQEKKSS